MSFFLLLNTKEDILSNVGNQKVAIDQSIFIFPRMEINGWRQLNIFFCVQWKKETNSGLEQHKGE